MLHYTYHYSLYVMNDGLSTDVCSPMLQLDPKSTDDSWVLKML